MSWTVKIGRFCYFLWHGDPDAPKDPTPLSREFWGIVWGSLVWLAKDLRLNVRAQCRQIKASFAGWFVPDDPKRFSTEPQRWYHYDAPETDVPPPPKPKNQVDLSVYSPEEILQMSESEYAIKCGVLGVMSYADAVKQAKKKMEKKSNAKPV